MHLEGRLQTGWECENRGCLPFFRRVPVATDSDCVECDDQQLAYQRGTIIHFPIRIRLDEGYGMLLQCHPTAVRRGVGGSRVAKHLHLPVAHDKQAETAGRERYDALIGEWAELFRDGLIRHRVVLYSAAGELDVAVDRDDATDPTQSEVVVRIRRLPRLGYGKLCSSNPHIHVAELFGEEPELLTRTVVPSVDPDVRAVFACLRVLDVEHESVFVCDCPIGFHPRAGKPYRLRRLTADQEYRRANRVDLVYGKLFSWSI